MVATSPARAYVHVRQTKLSAPRDLRVYIRDSHVVSNKLAIVMTRVDMATSFALRSGLDPGRLARTLGGECTGAWRDVDKLLHEIESVVNLEDYQHAKRILKKG